MTERATCLGCRARIFTGTVPGSLGLAVGLFLLAQLPPGEAAAGEPAEPQQTARFTEGGIEACLLCHNVERMRVISKTPHGNKDDPHTPFAKHGCESCHGPGGMHVTRLRRGEGRPLMIDYGRNVATPATQQSETCLDGCHADKLGDLEAMQWDGSTHAIAVIRAKDGTKRGVSCAACHQIHVAEDPLKHREEQAERCYRCHEKARKEHPRFEDKAIVFDKLSCWTCHDVHQLIPDEETLAARNAHAVAE